MKPKVYLTILIFIFQSSHAQSNKTLREKLWNQVQKCYSNFEDMDEDGTVDYDEIIDDSRNGYLKISGSWPTCGCNCENTIGAYKTNSNEYVFLKEYKWGCSWEKGINLSDDASKIFPFDFELDAFFGTKINNVSNNATLYLDFEIPRKGTDTKVTIRTIPLGLKVESKQNIEFGYTENARYSYVNMLFQIERIASKINHKSIEHLLNNNLSAISEKDKKIIEKEIETEQHDAVIKCLQELKLIYDIYALIKHDWIILGWNKDKGAFYIKEKGARTKIDSFKEFFKNTKKWSPTC